MIEGLNETRTDERMATLRPLRTCRIDRFASNLTNAPAGRMFSAYRGIPISTTVGEMFGAEGVHGLAIHTTSEIRAVRLSIGDGSSRSHLSEDWFDLVEGAPLLFWIPSQTRILIDALDRHDGALVLQAATTRDSVYALSADYITQAEICFGDTTNAKNGTGGLETMPATSSEPYAESTVIRFDIAPPRHAVSPDRKVALDLVCDGTASGSASLFSLVRDRGGNVVREDLVGTVGLANGVNSIAAVSLGAGRKWARVKIPTNLRCAGRVVLL